MTSLKDPMLDIIVNELVKKHKCHTVILYGSHARGDATETSDYDVMGVRKTGKSYRVAEKRNGKYIDLFIFPEKDVADVGDRHLYMSEAKILFDKDGFGKTFVRKLKAALKKNKFTPLPPDEIQVRQLWLHKMYERSIVGDLEGNFRRAWLQEALLAEYFNLRKLYYPGSKAAFKWLELNDKKALKLFTSVYADPQDSKSLKRLVELVSQLRL